MWDDFPPIYVPAFAMFQSSIPYTIEAPLNPRGGNLTPTSACAARASTPTCTRSRSRPRSKYIQDHRNQVIFDQAEVFRRGWAGEPPREIPDGFVPGWGPEDNYTTTFPRSYVIPAGARQRSAPAAKRLVDLLIGSGGRVTAGQGRRSPPSGTSYPAGLLRHRHAPAQARHRQLAARAGPGHHRPRRRPLRRPRRLEPGAHVGRDRRHAVGPSSRPSRPSASTPARPRASCPTAQHRPACWTRRTPRTCSRSTRCSARASRSRAWPTARC